MNHGVAKIAVSLPQGLLRELEQKRHALKKTRSAVVAEAIKAYLAVDALSEEELRYVRGYLLHPEDTAGARAIAKAASWSTWNEKK
jgi:metal-responsive CopG/Arc/MetJ family transcriptional regulator